MWDRVDTVVVKDQLGWGEGPAFLQSEAGIVFSDIPADVMYIFRSGDVQVYRRPSGRANGNTVDREGRLITCEHRTRRVTRTEKDGSVTTLVDHFGGLMLNSPNDVVVGPDDCVWFTDPPYGLLQGHADAPAEQYLPSAVYRYAPWNGRLDRIIDTLDKPNGIAISANGQKLYVSDTGYSNRSDGSHHIFRYDLMDGFARNMIVFREIQPGACDGLRIDADGHVWSTAGDGIHCYNPHGQEIGRIELGEMTTNLCFLPRAMGRGVFVTTPTRALCCRIEDVAGLGGLSRSTSYY
jgi:gluconolactonase